MSEACGGSAGRSREDSPACGRVLCVGLTVLDVAARVAAFPKPGEKVTALRQDVAAGGPASGAAVTAAALGAAADLLTALGSHPLARYVADDLAARGVVVHDATPERTGQPAVSAVAVHDQSGERTVVSPDAATMAVAAPAGVAELVRTADVVLVDGHHPTLALAAATAARVAGIPVLWDGGRWRAGSGRLVGLVDAAVCSSAFAVPGHAPGPGSAAALRAAGVPAVALTRGPDPVLWWTGQGAGEVAVPVVPVADTLGAGDAFHGALAYAVALRGWSPRRLPALLAVAVEVAALRVMSVGPRTWLAGLPGARLAGVGLAGVGRPEPGWPEWAAGKIHRD